MTRRPARPTAYRGWILLLLIPLVYGALTFLDRRQAPGWGHDQLCLSLRSGQGGLLYLVSGADTLARWEIKGGSSRFLQYRPEKGFQHDIRLVYTPSVAGDTLQLFSLNKLENKKMYGLDLKQLSTHFGTKTRLTSQELEFGPITVSTDLLPATSSNIRWFSASVPWWYHLVNALMVLVILLLMALLRPPDPVLRSGVLVTVLFMVILFAVRRESQTLIVTRFDKAVKPLEIFYNNEPVFSPNRMAVYHDSLDTYTTQINLDNEPFFRIDVPAAVQRLGLWQVSCKCGYLKKTFDIRSMPPGSLLVNDLEPGPRGAAVSGEDPFWALCSAPVLRELSILMFYHRQLFLWIPLLLFGLLILARRFWSELTPPQRFTGMTFLALITSFILLFPFNSRRMVMEAENRLPAAAPHLKLKKLDTGLEELKLFLNDQLPARSFLVSYRNYMEYSLFGLIHRPVPMVHFGKDGWMFYTGENVVEMYQNNHPYTEEELQKICNQLLKRRDWLRQKGIQYYIVFPHISNFVYEEKIGRKLRRIQPQSKLDQVLQYLRQHSDLKVIDVNAPIAEAKRKYSKPLYYRIDSHWNLFGSYFAYKALIGEIRKDFPSMRPPLPLDSIHWTVDVNHNGDLARLVSIDRFLDRIDYLPEHPFINANTTCPAPPYPDYLSVQPMVLQIGRDPAMPRMVMNRDSYSNYLLPYVSGHFSRSLFLWSPLFFPGVIEQEKPDIVILEMLERFLNDLLIEDPMLFPKYSN